MYCTYSEVKGQKFVYAEGGLCGIWDELDLMGLSVWIAIYFWKLLNWYKIAWGLFGHMQFSISSFG